MGRKRKNPIYSYYVYNADTDKSKCQMDGCQQEIKGHHAGNLLWHFYTQHRVEYENIQARNDSTENPAPAKSSKVVECCINLVAIHGRPLSLLEDEAFQTLIAMIPNHGLRPNIRNIRTSIENKAYDLRKKIYEELENKLVCLKVDVASVKSRRFLGINLQYISQAKLQLRNLGVVELHERNTAVYLKETVLMVLSRFGIEPHHIYSITSDNGANMLAMSREIDEISRDIASELDITYTESDEQEMLSLLDEVDALEFSSTMVTPIRCAVHTLQLAVRDACKEQEPIFEMCRRAARTLRTPNVTLELKQNRLLQAILDCPTRWDSTADMLERIVSLKQFCEEYHPDLIQTDQWVKIEECLQALKPCRILSKLLQAEQLTFGDFYIAWIKCLKELEEINTVMSIYLCICMKNREVNLLSNDIFLSAIYLDPRVNAILSDEQRERALNHLIHTYQSYNNLQKQSQEQPEQPVNYVVTEEPHSSQASTSASNIDCFFERLYNERQRDRPTDSINRLRNILTEFLNQPRLPTQEDILRYWYEKRLTDPQLYYLSTTVLATPPTQVSVERLFSSLKFILNNLRMSLKDSIIDDILIIRNNSLYEK